VRNAQIRVALKADIMAEKESKVQSLRLKSILESPTLNVELKSFALNFSGRERAFALAAKFYERRDD
jgi:hypothetical protein